tara:strand:+ start:787 stop:1452 length:666 start_codon:yes stop_codon:yes gene_type:complete
MKDYKEQIFSLFPTPVYNRVLGRINISEEELDGVKEKCFHRPNEGNSTLVTAETGSSNILDFDIFSNIKKEIEISVERYTKEYLRWNNNYNLKIVSSWMNVIDKEYQFHHAHSHANSIISGVFYLRTLLEDKIFFGREKLTSGFNVSIANNFEDFNIYNADNWWLPVENNYLYIFPSSLTHWVSNNTENDYEKYNRVSISFNTFFDNVELTPENPTTFLKV